MPPAFASSTIEAASRLILAVSGYVMQVTVGVDYQVPSAVGRPRGCHDGNRANRGGLSRDHLSVCRAYVRLQGRMCPAARPDGTHRTQCPGMNEWSPEYRAYRCRVRR